MSLTLRVAARQWRQAGSLKGLIGDLLGVVDQRSCARGEMGISSPVVARSAP